MVRSKQPNLVPATSKRKKSSGDDVEANLLVEDDWVLVKKQKINIIIPPSPVSERVTLPNVVENEPRTELIVVNDSRGDPKDREHDQMHCPCEKEISDSSIPKRIMVDDSGICQQPNPVLELLVPDHRVVPPNPPAENLRDHRIIGSCNASRAIKRLPISADRSAILNKRMRTLMIKKKLEQVGGLSKWLTSLGLDRFIKIFQLKGIDRYHLACLTASKLKEMGVYAVGPRRKLLHAIDRVCQPYCFQ